MRLTPGSLHCTRYRSFGRDDGESGTALLYVYIQKIECKNALLLYRKANNNQHSHHFERSRRRSREIKANCRKVNSECGITVDYSYAATPGSLHCTRYRSFGRDDGESGTALLYVYIQKIECKNALLLYRKANNNQHSHHFERSSRHSRDDGGG